jgi:hypothetical protein
MINSAFAFYILLTSVALGIIFWLMRPKKRPQSPKTFIEEVNIGAAIADLRVGASDCDLSINEGSKDVENVITLGLSPKDLGRPAQVQSASDETAPRIEIEGRTFSARGLQLHVEISCNAGSNTWASLLVTIIGARGTIMEGVYTTDDLLCRYETTQDWQRLKIRQITSLTDLSTGENVENPQNWLDEQVRRIALA